MRHTAPVCPCSQLPGIRDDARGVTVLYGAVLSTERCKYVAASETLRVPRSAVMPPATLAGQLRCVALSLCVLLLVCAGCRATRGPWAELPPPATVLSEVQPIWQHLAMRRQTFQNLKGLAQVRVYTTAQNVTIEDMVVLLHGFDAMRLEGIGPFGQPLFLLIAEGQRFSLYTPQEARLVSGTASADNLARLLGIALAPAVLHYMLIGDVPLMHLPTAGTFGYHARTNLYVWEGQGAERWLDYRIWFEPHHLQPVRFVVTEMFGEVVLDVQYDDFHPLGEIRLPYRIVIEQPRAGRRVVWQYTDVQLNAGISPALFRLRVPPGTQHLELD